jgi:3-keto-disaccharide hydrolase
MNMICKTFAFSLLMIFCNAICAQEINSLTKQEKKEGWKLLFDGKTTKGWRGAKSTSFPTAAKGWIVRDGTLTIQATDGSESQNAGDIVTTDEYSAFEISFDFNWRSR